MRIPLALLYCALALGACSISPLPVVRYRPADPGGPWDHGRQFLIAHSARLEIRGGFSALSYDPVPGPSGAKLLLFDITLTNRSGSAVLADPDAFRILVRGADTILPPIDPEAVIHQARLDKAAEDARHANELESEALSGTVTLAVDLASLGSPPTPKEKAEWDQAREDDRRRRRDEEWRHRENIAVIAERERSWSEGALRKTTLAPGMKIEGRIGFGLGLRAAAPDSLSLQYRNADGTFADLGLFGLVRDSVPTPHAKPVGDTRSYAR